ncbi:MAG: hypothetical protein WC045_03730 [Patescibacteria group bacterium]
MIFQQFVILILGVGIGILILVYRREIVRTVGLSGWAERVFGGGGTHTMWQLIGLLLIIGTVLYSTGKLTAVFDSIFHAIGL